MPNILANVELSTAQSAPVAWADVLGMSAVVDVKNADSIILLLATIPLKSSASIETAEFRFAVGGVREGPFCQGQHQNSNPIGSADISTFAYALTGLTGSQTFSVQWQQVLNTLTLNTTKIRNFQVIELLAGDRLDILGTAYDRTSGIDSAAAYAVVSDLTLTVPVEATDSVVVLAGTLPIGQGTGSDRVASCQLADGGVVEGGEAIIYSDSLNEGTGLSTLMRAKAGISGSHTFSLQWKTEPADLAGQISLFRERSLQALELRPANFPVVEATATSTTSSSINTHTITTPAGVVAGDLLIAFIGLENLTSPAGQFSGLSDGFTEIKDKTTGGTAGASLGVFFKVSDGTEGANITVTSVDAERAAHCMYRISNHNPSIAPEITAGASGLSTAPDPDSLSPAGGIKDFLYMVFAGYNKDDFAITAFPTDYDDNQINHAMFSGATIGIATRNLTIATQDPGVFTMSGSEEWQAFTLAVHPPVVPTVALTGTATATIEENDILDGGKTIILTLTDDIWVAAGAPFNAIRQDIIDGMVSDIISGTGFNFWNNVVTPNEVVGAVVRTSDTVVTITLTAQPLYNIFSVDPAIIQETITVTVPASALEDTNISVVASPDFTVDQSPVDVIITGTMDGSDETDIVAGGRTMLLTLRQDSFTSMWGATQAQLIIDGLNSAQSELTGWNNEVRDKMPVTDVVRTGNQLLTITFSAQAGYDITLPEVITATIPGSVLTGTPPDFDATPDINIAVGPATAALSGTITPASTEAQIVAGGRTLLITLSNDTWVASGAAFNGARQAIIDGITSAQVEVTGWNNEVRDSLPVGQVIRTSDTVVTVTFVPETGYNIVDFEEITVTVPASAILGSVTPVVATPTFVIFEVPVALVSGTVVPDADEDEIVAGGQTIILTLIDDEWVVAGPEFDSRRQALLLGLTSAGSELLGWNNEVRDKEVVTAVVRTSDTVVTITLTASPLYDITLNETITVTVPGAILDQTPNPITGVPTFTVIKEAGSHMRSRRGGKHAEDIFDVNEPDVATFEVNKFE